MQQFILEEQLEVICDKDGREFEEIAELEKEEFIQVMLKIHQANSSRKWRYDKKCKNGEIRPLAQHLSAVCGGF